MHLAYATIPSKNLGPTPGRICWSCIQLDDGIMHLLLGTLWTYIDMITTCPQDHVTTLDIRLRKLIDPHSDVSG